MERWGHRGRSGTRAELSPLCLSWGSAGPKVPAAPFQGVVSCAQHSVCSLTHAVSCGHPCSACTPALPQLQQLQPCAGADSAEPQEGCSSPRSLFSFPPASQTAEAISDPIAARQQPQGTLMPSGSVIPHDTPRQAFCPSLSVPAGPAAGLGGSLRGKHQASLWIKRPRGDGKGV